MTRSPRRLDVRGLCKRYAAPVLVDLDFDLEPGEVHALMGANGAGKSTLARVVTGWTASDAGTITLDGVPYAPTSPRVAESAGVLLVPQELNLVPTLSVAENLFLDRLPSWGGWIAQRRLDALARVALQRVGLEELDPRQPAGRLGVGRQQLVEIARALDRDCRVLILDEPTAALTDPEIERLFENVRRLQSAGVGVLYISHRLDEIRRIANRVSVLRDGRHMAVHQASDVTPAQLVREMSGHDLPERTVSDKSQSSAVALRVEGLSNARLHDVSFSLQRGEILGLAGLVGSGRTETLRAIFGADRLQHGQIYLGDGPARRFHEPAQAVAAGLGFVPEDRKHDGLLLPLSVQVNSTLSTLDRHSRYGWLRRDSESRMVTHLCEQLAVRSTGLDQAVQTLSGGNQQKIVLARWLAHRVSVLLCDEPTRGVDAAAKDTIHELLRELARAGTGILVVSSELPELMTLCDRILVLSAGRITGEFHAGRWSQESINSAAFQGYLGPVDGQGKDAR